MRGASDQAVGSEPVCQGPAPNICFTFLILLLGLKTIFPFWSTMLERRLLHSAVILWLVQTVYTGGYGPASGAANGQGPQLNGRKPQNGGGVGGMLIPSKGVGQTMGAQSGYGGYPTKGVGYGVQAGPANGQQMKGNGYGAHSGGYNGHGTKGNGYGALGALGGNGAKSNGNSAGNTAHNRLATKGQGGAAGPSSSTGARANGQGGAGSKPMKGYGRPPYGAGPGVGMGPSRGLGVPQLARNQGKAHGGMGYNGYGAKPIGGYNGGFGHAGLGLGSQQGGMKGPKHGSSGVAGVPNGQGAKPNGMAGYAGARVPGGNGAVPNGYGYQNGGSTKPAKQGYGGFLGGYGTKPNGYGTTRGGVARPQTGYGTGALPNGYGSKSTGHGAAAGAGVHSGGHAAKPNGHGVRNTGAFGGFGGYGGPSRGSKPQTKGATNQGATALGTGYGAMPNVKGTMGAGASSGKGFKGGVLSPVQPSASPLEGVAAQLAVNQGVAPFAPEPTKSIFSQEKYQGKGYKQPMLIPQITPEPAPVLPQGNIPVATLGPTPESALLGAQGKGLKVSTSGPASVFSQSNPAPEPAAVLPQGYVTGSAVPEKKGAETDVQFGVDGTGEGAASLESTKPVQTKADPETVAAKNTGSIVHEETLAVDVPEFAPEEENTKSQPEAGPDRPGVKGLPAGGIENRASVSKGQGSKPDCGPSGGLNGQWVKVPRPDYNAGAGASAGTKTKGYGAGAGLPNMYGAKPNGYGAVPGLSNGYGAGVGYPYAGNPKQPGYGQGPYLGARHGNSYGGYGNGYHAGVQPDYASLGQGVPPADAKSGGAGQVPYNEAPVVPSGLNGMSQFKPQSAGLGPNGKLASMYAGMGGLPYGGQTLGMGAKYGIGGLQFGGQPLNTGANGGKYGYGAGPNGPIRDGKTPGKYGYGRMPYEAQPAQLGPEAKAAGKNGMSGSPYQPESLGLDHNGQLSSKYGGGDVPHAPQGLGLGGEAKSFDHQGAYQAQPLESASEARSDTAGLSYESLPSEADLAGKSYVKGELQTPAAAVEGEVMPVDGYDNVGYISGHVQPKVVPFPAAATTDPSLLSYLPAEASFTPDVAPGGVEDLPDSMGTTGLRINTAPAQVPEEPDDDLQQQLPRQIQIQQHLKLHFHPQGAKDGKYDLNGFFGNSGYQG